MLGEALNREQLEHASTRATSYSVMQTLVESLSGLDKEDRFHHERACPLASSVTAIFELVHLTSFDSAIRSSCFEPCRDVDVTGEYLPRLNAPRRFPEPLD